MRILATFPGRFGDLLWALPTIRALSRRIGQPVDLQIAGEFASIVPLLQQQPYLQDVCADDRWSLTPPDEWAAPPLSVGDGYGYAAVLNLGYRGWPQRPLPFEVLDTFNRWSQIEGKWTKLGVLAKKDLDLQTPWITIDGPGDPVELFVGFTEAWFELKLGLVVCLQRRLSMPLIQYTPPGSRWRTEGRGVAVVETADWCALARAIRNSDLFFGDCSALHVLAVALGKPVVMMEPMQARWNDIFYPLGKDGPCVTLIRGNDGEPTFDARHCADALERALAGLSGKHA